MTLAVLAFSPAPIAKGILMFLFVVSGLLLGVVVLLQEGKGGGLAGAFGGAAADTFGVKAGSVNRFTAVLAGVFILIALAYAGISAATESVIPPSPPPTEATPGPGAPPAGAEPTKPPEPATPAPGATPPAPAGMATTPSAMEGTTPPASPPATPAPAPSAPAMEPPPPPAPAPEPAMNPPAPAGMGA